MMRNRITRFFVVNILIIAAVSIFCLCSAQAALTWTSVGSQTSYSLLSVAYGSSGFVAVGANGTILKSPDGSSWSTVSSATTAALHGIAYGNGMYMAAGYGGTILYSTDGTAWSSLTATKSADFSRVVYGNGIFVVISADGTVLSTSDNGNTWKNTNIANLCSNGCYPKGLAYGNGKFVIMNNYNSTSNSYVSYYGISSADGYNWTGSTATPIHLNKTRKAPYFAYYYVYGLTYGNGQFISIGYYYGYPSGWPGNFILSSSDTKTWQSTDISYVNTLSISSIDFGGNKFILTGDGGILATSSDAVTGESNTSNVKTKLNKMAYGNGVYVVVGDSGVILKSVASDYDMAVSAINDIYGKYSSIFGTKSGGVTTGTTSSGTFYVQWFTNGTGILAWTDGYLYYYGSSGWISFGVSWNDYIRASEWITVVYNQYTSYFGTKSGGVTTGTTSSGTFYVQWFTNGTGILAWTDGYIYYYDGSGWVSFGVSWK
ncbi:MAG: hypothetical protein HQL01_10135 [Nitrospirae bacterium]|nr:hypothetical protein [Nitrospirota bacterium]